MRLFNCVISTGSLAHFLVCFKFLVPDCTHCMNANSHQDSLLEQCPWFLQRGDLGIRDRNFSTGRIEKYSVKFSSIFPTQSTNNNPDGLGHSNIPTCSCATPCYAIRVFRVTLVDVSTIILLSGFELKTNKQTTKPLPLPR